MTIAELLLEQMESELPRTRATLERVPEGHNDWKPHPKSMPLGYLAALVARMPAWTEMMIDHDTHDIAPAASEYKPAVAATRTELLELFDRSAAAGRAALKKASDEHLKTRWQLLYAGRVVSDEIRYRAIADGLLSHLAHHRGQLSVYLRLNEASVPAMYGPSADEGRF